MTDTGWLVLALIEFPIAFSLGVLAGVRVQHHRLTREVAVQVRVIKRWWDQWGNVVVGLFLIIMAVFTYQSERTSHQSSRVSQSALSAVKQQNSCLTTYANQLHDSLVPRQRATKQLQHADNLFNVTLLRLFTDALVKSPQTPGARAKAHRDVLSIKDALEAKTSLAATLNRDRAAHPYPPPPKKVCPK